MTQIEFFARVPHFRQIQPTAIISETTNLGECEVSKTNHHRSPNVESPFFLNRRNLLEHFAKRLLKHISAKIP